MAAKSVRLHCELRVQLETRLFGGNHHELCSLNSVSGNRAVCEFDKGEDRRFLCRLNDLSGNFFAYIVIPVCVTGCKHKIESPLVGLNGSPNLFGFERVTKKFSIWH